LSVTLVYIEDELYTVLIYFRPVQILTDTVP